MIHYGCISLDMEHTERLTRGRRWNFISYFASWFQVLLINLIRSIGGSVGIELCSPVWNECEWDSSWGTVDVSDVRCPYSTAKLQFGRSCKYPKPTHHYVRDLYFMSPFSFHIANFVVIGSLVKADQWDPILQCAASSYSAFFTFHLKALWTYLLKFSVYDP